MINCICGLALLGVVSEDSIVTLEGEHRWMRRRSDLLMCRGCSRRYPLGDLRVLAETGIPVDPASVGSLQFAVPPS